MHARRGNEARALLAGEQAESQRAARGLHLCSVGGNPAQVLLDAGFLQEDRRHVKKCCQVCSREEIGAARRMSRGAHGRMQGPRSHAAGRCRDEVKLWIQDLVLGGNFCCMGFLELLVILEDSKQRCCHGLLKGLFNQAGRAQMREKVEIHIQVEFRSRWRIVGTC
ncbi:hypothetical protein MA16_Dca028812 [Dendrobium catenatum]|uniref:Uncharacterized protein n=1 Tax=Dendrobium catenatum TaxID=906689 RepID=A0A2I0VGD3_9ASPA|nr:hypothetical protein MA16_Dca028812 [Dendrobium catenatum]